MNNALIMLTCNRNDYTQKTLENYERQLKQTGHIHDFKFFLYDNGSTDGTAQYLRSYKGELDLEVTFSEKNIGIADATKYLLKEKCFDKGFDFIVKVDDDELIPDGWENILTYWKEIEAKGAVFIGFKRNNQYDYFDGYKWIDNKELIEFGPFECYLSALAPGIQISTQYWWERMFNQLSDFGCLYGGWDHTIFVALKYRFKKSFMLVYNYETDHFQKREDHLGFSQVKEAEMVKFKKKMEFLDKFEAMRQKSKQLGVKFPEKDEVWELVTKLFQEKE